MGRVRDACFVVKDADGFAVSFVYYEIEQGRKVHRGQSPHAERARRIAASIAKLPGFLKRPRD
jgi:hypothetical protein